MNSVPSGNLVPPACPVRAHSSHTQEEPLENLEITPLTVWHRENGAKMAPFAGFDMPVQYKGIIVEHKHTRSKAGIFDICHMGEFALVGPGARDALNKIVSHDLETLAPGKCRYGFLLKESGGINDDLIIYCLAEDEYMLVVNGACREKDFSHIAANLPDGLAFTDISDQTGKIDIQGPESLEVLNSLMGEKWNHLKYFNFETTNTCGFPMLFIQVLAVQRIADLKAQGIPGTEAHRFNAVVGNKLLPYFQRLV